MQEKTLNAHSETSHRVANWIASHPIARLCSIGLLLFVLTLCVGCASARQPYRTVEVKVPVKPEIPAETLAPCAPAEELPVGPLSVGALLTWAEDLSIALERCNMDKVAIRNALK